MPATRSPRQSSARPPLMSHETNARSPCSSDVILLSSDDDATSGPLKHVAKRQKQRGRGKVRRGTPFPPDPQDIIEILSDDEQPAPRASASKGPHSTIASLQKQLKIAQEEIEKLRAEAQARNETPSLSSNAVLATLEENVNCEICTLKMWTPATLACGHTFCQTCLRDWFKSTLTKHAEVHPRWRERYQIAMPYRVALRDTRLHPLERNQLEAQMRVIMNQLPDPEYTCPTCRAPVKARPAEVYALKSIIHAVGAAVGESSPKPAAPFRRHGPGHIHRPEDPWDAFFD